MTKHALVIELQLKAKQVAAELAVREGIGLADRPRVGTVGHRVHRHEFNVLVELPFDPDFMFIDYGERSVAFGLIAAFVILVSIEWKELAPATGFDAIHRHGIAAMQVSFDDGCLRVVKSWSTADVPFCLKAPGCG